MVPALNAYLTDKLPAFVTVQDASLDVIALLRILHAFNRYWSTMYEVSPTFIKLYKLLWLLKCNLVIFLMNLHVQNIWKET